MPQAVADELFHEIADGATNLPPDSARGPRPILLDDLTTGLLDARFDVIATTLSMSPQRKRSVSMSWMPLIRTGPPPFCLRHAAW